MLRASALTKKAFQDIAVLLARHIEFLRQRQQAMLAEATSTA